MNILTRILAELMALREQNRKRDEMRFNHLAHTVSYEVVREMLASIGTDELERLVKHAKELSPEIKYSQLAAWYIATRKKNLAMKSIPLRHIEITEELRDHPFGGQYYRVAKFGPFKAKVLPPETDASKLDSSVKVHTYEIIEVPSAQMGRPTYFGVDVDKYGILYALLGHTEHSIEKKIEQARENERGFSKWMMERKVREIKALPWFKRLLNKF
jgi:hypothetical protein